MLDARLRIRRDFGDRILEIYERDSKNPNNDKVFLVVCKDDSTIYAVGMAFKELTGHGFITSDREKWKK